MLLILSHPPIQDAEKTVSTEEGVALAKELGSLFLECSAKTRANVEQCFEELASKVLLSHAYALRLCHHRNGQYRGSQIDQSLGDIIMNTSCTAASLDWDFNRP